MIYVSLRGGLDRLTGGVRAAEANGGTVGEVLYDLCSRFEGLEHHLFQPGSGQLRGHLFVARNGDQARPEDVVVAIAKRMFAESPPASGQFAPGPGGISFPARQNAPTPARKNRWPCSRRRALCRRSRPHCCAHPAIVPSSPCRGPSTSTSGSALCRRLPESSCRQYSDLISPRCSDCPNLWRHRRDDNGSGPNSRQLSYGHPTARPAP